MKSNVSTAPRARAAAVPFPSASVAHQRRVALALGSVMLASSICSAFGLATARASEEDARRSRQYKVGAAVLGAATAYYGLKSKKVVPAIVAGAGAYYAYKKSKEYKNRSEADRYGYGNGDANYPGQDRYPDEDSGSYAGGDYGYGGDYGNDYGDEPARGGYEDYASVPGGGYGSAYPDYTNGLRAQRSARRVSKSPARTNSTRSKRAISVK